MDLRQAIKDLQNDGYSEQRIADELKEAGVDCTQATINRIKLGRISNPSFAVGSGIIQLHQRNKRRPVSQRRAQS